MKVFGFVAVDDLVHLEAQERLEISFLSGLLPVDENHGSETLAFALYFAFSFYPNGHFRFAFVRRDDNSARTAMIGHYLTFFRGTKFGRDHPKGYTSILARGHCADGAVYYV